MTDPSSTPSPPPPPPTLQYASARERLPRSRKTIVASVLALSSAVCQAIYLAGFVTNVGIGLTAMLGLALTSMVLGVTGIGLSVAALRVSAAKLAPALALIASSIFTATSLPAAGFAAFFLSFHGC